MPHNDVNVESNILKSAGFVAICHTSFVEFLIKQ